MKKVLLGVFAALAMACSSSGSGGPTGDSGHTDGGGTDTNGGGDVVTDTHGGTDTHHDVVPGDVSDSTCAENTVGNTCTADTDCDPCKTSTNVCAVNVLPTAVCVSISSAGGGCDPGDGTKIVACDNADGTDRGVCLSDGAGGGDCFPACSWKDDGSAVTGCQGKDHCNWMGWNSSATPITGVGYCFQGCKADADCGKATGSTTTKCDVFTGICQKTLPTYTKTVGQACTYKTGTGAVQDCACFAAAATNMGYCSQFCDIGDTTCGTGFVCSGFLPSACASGTPLFTKSPSAGLAGNCLKTCTADADCTAINSTCETTPEGKVCVPFKAGSGC
jgi:hypothetical protein